MIRLNRLSSTLNSDSPIRPTGTVCRFSGAYALVLLAAAASLVACGGTAASDGSGDGDLVGDGEMTGDGDVGDGDLGDGDRTGDGDIGDGDGDGLICTSHYAYGLNVLVVGGADSAGGAGAGDPTGGAPPPQELVPAPATGGSGNRVYDPCLGSVTATEGDYVEALECYSDGLDCRCNGAGERAGTYAVTATAGELEETQTVTVSADECHVQGESLTFFER